ncbi:uncharacterized protein LOC118185611 [Stegodyphus dumicola]|uniref:uncharacterized protein LOC118185611 n=1 Tax=Stegodyphus dumicola TaxID=202533 RepID=UPI0015B2DA9C|nr:uncharacterized protein LOC118185611 [Stegodyphus dumicola]XP_035211388.1 uncharacterized protein LOC118185611 [Stegodyphus dumicola]
MFHMEIYNSLVEHMVDNITKLDKPTFLIRNLSPGTSYVLVIYASNVKGRSNSVALVTSTPFPAEKRTAQHDQMQLSPVLVILIGVIALFVISAVVIVIIIRSHIPKENASKDAVASECTNDCDREKKDLEESQESASEKGPDIIPESKESEVFFTGRVTDSPATEYVHQKYLDTAL